MKDLIGYCGLDCEACDARIATVRQDDALREKTAKLWSKLNNAPITAEMIHCMGCRSEGVKTVFCEKMCGIRACARGKGYATCGDCPEKSRCAVLSGITSGNPEAMENLLCQAKS